MKRRIIFLLYYYCALMVLNLVFYIVSLIGDFGWKPYPSVTELVLFPLFFVVFGLLVSSFLYKTRPYISIAFVWVVVSGILLSVNYMNGYELISLTNGNISYLTRQVDFIFKNNFGVVGVCEEIFIQIVVVLSYHLLVGKISFYLMEKFTLRE